MSETTLVTDVLYAEERLGHLMTSVTYVIVGLRNIGKLDV